MGWKNGGGKEYNKKVEEKLIKETYHGLKKKVENLRREQSLREG